MSRYAYDARTFRVCRIRSERYLPADDEQTYRPTGAPLQDVRFDYDLVGNVRAVHDRTPGSGIVGNPAALATDDPALRQQLAAGDALDRVYTYDPLYRLTSATGRECQTPVNGDPWIDLPRNADVTKAQPYTETYRYDAAGSLRQIVHTAAAGFTLTLDNAADGSNRWSRAATGSAAYDYRFDPVGNLVGETLSRHFGWDHADRLITFATQTAGSEPSIHAHYLYDAAGQRVKKLVRRQGGAVEVIHYLDQIFEHHRWTTSPANPAAAANNHIHVTDDRQRVAIVRIGPAHPDDSGPAVAVHLADHLGSSVAVVDQTGTLLNREEYAPFGQTTFGSYQRKRYRFLGRERDEESGLNQQGARYYAPWLGRWISCDPAGITGGADLYGYAAGNPLTYEDGRGTQPKPAPTLTLPTTSAEARSLISTATARIKNQPNEPVYFSDKGIAVMVMRLPEPFVVLRSDGQTFTDAALAANTAGVGEIIVNAEMYETVGFGGARLPGARLDYRAQGQVIDHGRVVEGRTAPQTFYMAWNQKWASDAWQQMKTIADVMTKAGIPVPAPPLDPAYAWRFGFGDPPADSEIAFGGGVPVIVGGLPYGPTNLYKPGAPKNLPDTGDPGPNNEQYLIQRSNGVFAGQETKRGGKTLGKVVTGINRADNLLFVMVQEDGNSGLLLSQMRDTLQLLGVTDALAWDGSNSATLVRDSTIYVTPASRKNEKNPVGAGFRLK